jgi:hypothetical protein
MYRSEQKFSAALLRVLKDKCPLIQRIESGETGRGIPDLYLRYPAGELWVELKNDYRQTIKQPCYSFPYRPGQIGWHYKYYRASGRKVLTVMAVRDGFVIAGVTKPSRCRHIDHCDCWVMDSLKDVLTVFESEVKRG